MTDYRGNGRRPHIVNPNQPEPAVELCTPLNNVQVLCLMGAIRMDRKNTEQAPEMEDRAAEAIRECLALLGQATFAEAMGQIRAVMAHAESAAKQARQRLLEEEQAPKDPPADGDPPPPPTIHAVE